MKALTYYQYGSYDQLQVNEVDKPSPKKKRGFDKSHGFVNQLVGFRYVDRRWMDYPADRRPLQTSS